METVCSQCGSVAQAEHVKDYVLWVECENESCGFRGYENESLGDLIDAAEFAFGNR